MNLKPFRCLWPSIRPHRIDLLVATIAAQIAQGSGIALPLVARHTIHALKHKPLDNDAVFAALWQFALILLGLAFVRGMSRWQERMRGERAGQRFIADLRRRMYAHLPRLPQGYFDRRSAGKVLIRFVGDSLALKTWLARTVITVPADIITIIVVAVALVMIRYELLLAALVPMSLLIPAMWLINPRARRLTRVGRRHQSHLAGYIGESIASLGPIKACGAQQTSQSEAMEAIQDTADANITRGRVDATSQMCSIVAGTLTLGAVVLMGAWLRTSSELASGDLLAAVWLTLLVRGPITRLIRANTIHQRARVAADRVGVILERAPERGWDADLPAFVPEGRRIRLRRLGYHTRSNEWVFRGIDADIHGPGLTVAGDETGQAKRILFELLLRIRRPHEGRIRIDGQDVRKVHIPTLRKAIGWVDRNRQVVLAVSSVLRSDPARIESDLLESAWPATEKLAPGVELATCFDALHAPERYTHIGPTIRADVRLRVAMAFALVGDPRLLLLDDPSANLNDDAVARLLRWLVHTAEQRLVIVGTNDGRIAKIASQHIQLTSHPAQPQPVPPLRLVRDISMG